MPEWQYKKTAETHGISCKTAFQYYTLSKKEILRKIGFIQNYRQEKAKLLLTIRKYEINQQNLLNEINHLKDQLIKYTSHHENSASSTNLLVSSEIAQVLSCSLKEDLSFSPRLMNSLETKDLKTVEDLLRFIKPKGMDRLLTLNGYGEKAHKELKEKLLLKGILNEANEIPLLQYIY